MVNSQKTTVTVAKEKLWDKNQELDNDIERYTVGRDRDMDLYLAKADIIGSMAHVTMLASVGLIEKDELSPLLRELRILFDLASSGQFVIEPEVEDVHSQVEIMLTRRLGDLGKKIHSGRSRNDQVLVDLKIFTRWRIRDIADLTVALFNTLMDQSERYRDVLLPGYTHLQVAMPSSFGLWFGAYAESLTDDLRTLHAAYQIANRNPLGSAAGYGSSFPLNRTMTTRLLGFEGLNYNVVYAQMGRGKMERIVAQAIGNIANTVAKLSMDACLYNSQNFGFIHLAEQYTTGSSIMPHKKNPDVFELTRSKCNRLQGIANDILLMTNNLPSGYFRDLQLIKEVYLPAFDLMEDVLKMVRRMIADIEVNEHITDDPRYDAMWSVEEVRRLVDEGMPFRDAYKKVGLEVNAGTFHPVKQIHHTHEGSISNLCSSQVRQLMSSVYASFPFQQVEEAERQLLNVR
ncbi:MAG: argininosuccinate lyase [Paludibacteraceae bacterium]|nr:argininosuccinate lyase [Paludibacteraceae bacterium]